MKEARRPTPEIGMRMKELRESIGISQAVLAERINATQSSVNRYENGQSPPPLDYLRRFADFFDVYRDYIFCRTDKPPRTTYDFNPTITPDKEDMRRFIEMCFDPASPMNKKLKEILFQMMEGRR